MDCVGEVNFQGGKRKKWSLTAYSLAETLEACAAMTPNDLVTILQMSNPRTPAAWRGNHLIGCIQ
jgi:hypothetical protein